MDIKFCSLESFCKSWYSGQFLNYAHWKFFPLPARTFPGALGENGSSIDRDLWFFCAGLQIKPFCQATQTTIVVNALLAVYCKWAGVCFNAVDDPVPELYAAHQLCRGLPSRRLTTFLVHTIQALLLSSLILMPDSWMCEQNSAFRGTGWNMFLSLVHFTV